MTSMREIPIFGLRIFGCVRNFLGRQKIENLCDTEEHTKKIRPTDELVLFCKTGSR
jgi:hypothetical protein